MAKPAYMILAWSIKGLLMNDLLMKGLITKDLHIKVGFPNRFVFSSKGPHPGLFVLQGPENGPDITEKSGFLS